MSEYVIDYLKDIIGGIDDGILRFKDITYNDLDGFVIYYEYFMSDFTDAYSSYLRGRVRYEVINKLTEYGMNDIPYHILYEKM